MIFTPSVSYSSSTSRTLVQMGSDLVFDAYMNSADESLWGFEILSFIIGDVDHLNKYCSDFVNINLENRFIVIESPGDGRIITRCPQFRSDSSKLQIFIPIGDKPVITNPYDSGVDIVLDEGDIMVDNEDIVLSEGVETTIKILLRILSTNLSQVEPLYIRTENGIEDVPMYEFSSFFPEYFNKYRNNLNLLKRLFKLEIYRLATIPVFNDSVPSTPPLNFVKKIHDIELDEVEPTDGRIRIKLSLEWGNEVPWSDIVYLYVGEV